jgi:hypothetical protein
MVRRAYEAFNRGDPEGMFAEPRPSPSTSPRGRIPGAGGMYGGTEQFGSSWTGGGASSTNRGSRSTS